MNAQPASVEAAREIRASSLALLGLITAIAVLVFFTYSWMDSRKVPTITFVATPTSHIAVDVRGAVSTPGVAYLEPGSRLIDVVESSGGMTSDADQSLVNLSSRVMDGQIVTIPTQSAVNASQNSSGRININTASIDELMQLPGIGEVYAQRIIAYREFNGPFQSIDELSDIEGISASLVESLQPYISVSDND